MVAADLRGFLRRLEVAGEVRRVPADQSRETALASCRSTADSDPPALWFPARDAVAVSQVAGLYITSRRLALALDLPANLSLLEIADALDEPGRGVDAQFVAPSAAACKQVILRGAAADARRFCPAAATAGVPTRALLVMGAPALGELHVGLAAVEAVDQTRVIGRLPPPLAAPRFLTTMRAAARGAAARDIALVLGNEPAVTLGFMGARYADDPYSAMSDLKGNPLSVTECETSELEVPALAEVVLEGRLSAASEGESLGYELEIELHTATHRRDPVVECWRDEAAVVFLAELLSGE